MKNIAKNIHLLCLLTVPIVLLATISLRTIALLTSYEADIGRYSSPTLSFAVGGILVAVTIALAILTHEMRELFVAVPDYRDLPSLFSGVFATVTLMFFAVTFPIDLSGDAPFVFVMALLAAILAAAGSLLFVYRGFRTDAAGGAPAMLALPLALFSIPAIVALSFTSTLRIADPAVNLTIVAFAAVAFFFLGEARIALGRAKWALHTCITVLTVIFTATQAIPNLIYHAVRGSAILGNTPIDFVMLGFFLYSLARLVLVFSAAQREGKDAMRFAMGSYMPAATADEAPVAQAEAVVDENQREDANEEDTDR